MRPLQGTCLPQASVSQAVISHQVIGSGSEGALGHQPWGKEGRLEAGILPFPKPRQEEQEL